MRSPSRVALFVLLLVVSAAASSATAAGQPISGPRETVDSRLSTARPNASAGFHYSGSYHAAGNPNGNPPYMRHMLAISPGLRYDTSVPARCAASDVTLATFGAAACPASSRLGGGTVESDLLGQFPSTLHADVLNNTDEQIILVSSPGVSSITRGHIYPDGSVEFAAPTCFPNTQLTKCPVDDVLQLRSDITVAPYSRSSNASVRSYMTTPPTCPATGQWKMPIRFWWADGSIDTVVTEQPCTHPRSASSRHGPRVSRHRRIRRSRHGSSHTRPHFSKG